MGDFLFADAVIFEEFNWDRFKFNLPQIKRLLEGKIFSVDVKCRNKKDICFKGPVILVSNDPPLEEEAYIRRLRIVFTEEPFWLGTKTAVVETKVEPMEEAEVFTISSDEEV
jgi:hypothetical protein